MTVAAKNLLGIFEVEDGTISFTGGIDNGGGVRIAIAKNGRTAPAEIKLTSDEAATLARVFSRLAGRGDPS